MSTLISAHQLSKSFAAKQLFSKISFAIDDNEKIGLIGPNGAGKTTLLSILSKKMDSDSGKLSFSQNLKLAYLTQSPTLQENLSIYDNLMNSCDDIYDYINIQLAYELISKLGLDTLPEGAEKNVSELSGGWRKKVALACELMKRPNLLILDEPTNHLDLPSILWLEDFLKKANQISLLIVTHDRKFLQNTCNAIFDLDPQLPNGLLRTNGSYADHLESKMMLLDGQMHLEEKKRNTMMREKEWLARGPQARLTKQKARIERAYDLIDEVDGLERKNTKRSLNLDFGNQSKSPKRLIEAKDITISYNDNVLLKDFSCLIRPKHRYGLIGANGSGKSSLLKCLIGKLPPTLGEVFTNPDIKISYFEQGKDSINPNISLLKTVCPEGDYVHFQGTPVFARSYLNRFNFKSGQLDLPVKQLSGGEVSRLILAKLMLNDAHVLILDEPTNDLDVETLESLSGCLDEFQGAVILVTHDRYFMDQNSDVIWGLDEINHNIVTFADTEQWEVWHNEKSKNANSSSSAKSEKNQKKNLASKSGLSFKEKTEFDGIEEKIKSEEKKLADLNSELATIDTQNYQLLTDLTASISKQESTIEKLFARWEELTKKNIV